MGVPSLAVPVNGFTRGVINTEWGREHPWEAAGVIFFGLIVLCVVIKSLQHMGCIKEETQEGDASPV
jgi:hypothetical protein